MWRRVLGGVMIATGVLGILLCLAGLVLAPGIIDNVATDLDTMLTNTVEQVDVLQETLLLTKATLADVNRSLDTVESTTINASDAMSNTGILIDELARMAGETVPINIDAAVGALPSFSELARTVDQALSKLSEFNVDTQVLGVPIKLDLGIDYDPAAPLDEPLTEIGQNLDLLAADLRSQTTNLGQARQNVDLIGQDMQVLSQDLRVINDRLADYGPLLDQYVQMTENIGINLTQAREDLASNLRLAKAGVILLSIWLGLAQLAPLYLGWELMTEKRQSTP